MAVNASQCQCGMPVSPCARCVGQKYIEAETIWLIYMCVELYRVPMKLQVCAGHIDGGRAVISPHPILI